MNKTILPFTEAFASYNRAQHKEYIDKGKQERKQILDLFPLDGWASMPLEKYALGQPSVENPYCAVMEYRSPHLGSIQGGSAKKLLIYKRKSKEGWYFDPSYETVVQAWDSVRSGFVQAFVCARNSDFAAIDQIKSIAFGPALCVKTLHAYFPESVLPVFSRDHLIHFQ